MEDISFVQIYEEQDSNLFIQTDIAKWKTHVTSTVSARDECSLFPLPKGS